MSDVVALTVQTEHIKSLENYIEKVCGTATSFAWFDTFFNTSRTLTLYRGQDEDWNLLPKIARKDFLKTDILKMEDRLISEFERLSYPFVDIDLNNKWNLLAIAQHHRLPTRLLDWTENPLVALWFAVIKDNENTADRIVWQLVLNEEHVIDTKSSDPFKLSKTTVFKPNHITRRIAAQAGWFTVHYYNKTNKTFVPLNKNKEYHSKLKKFCIPNALRKDILLKLDKLGINSFTLFPDMDGLSSYLEWKSKILELPSNKKVHSKTKKMRVVHSLEEKLRGKKMR